MKYDEVKEGTALYMPKRYYHIYFLVTGKTSDMVTIESYTLSEILETVVHKTIKLFAVQWRTSTAGKSVTPIPVKASRLLISYILDGKLKEE